MFENLKKEEYKEIDLKALRKKEEINYITQVSEQYWDKFAKLLNCQEQVSGDELEKRVFDETKKAIDSIEEHCRPIGVIIYGKGVIESFEVELGWLTARPLKKGSDSYTLYPSEQGFKLYDRLREIQGKLPIREANEKVREMVFPDYDKN